MDNKSAQFTVFICLFAVMAFILLAALNGAFSQDNYDYRRSYKYYTSPRYEYRSSYGTSSSSSSSSSGYSYSYSYSTRDSYNEGYDDMYENEDFDEYKYDYDSDYAAGVEDAMDDLGW